MSSARCDSSGQVAVVTGGASGIEAETAQLLQSFGATVVCWDVQPAGPDALQVDVADGASVARAAQQTLARWGRILQLHHRRRVRSLGRPRHVLSSLSR